MRFFNGTPDYPAPSMAKGLLTLRRPSLAFPLAGVRRGISDGLPVPPVLTQRAGGAFRFLSAWRSGNALRPQLPDMNCDAVKSARYKFQRYAGSNPAALTIEDGVGNRPAHAHNVRFSHLGSGLLPAPRRYFTHASRLGRAFGPAAALDSYPPPERSRPSSF